MLSIRGLNVAIRNVQILREVSLELPQGSMTGLIGRNGAGKTTLMKSLMGILKAASGSVRFGDTDLLALATHKRARLGIGYMPEDRRLVPELTAEENILAPAWAARAPAGPQPWRRARARAGARWRAGPGGRGAAGGPRAVCGFRKYNLIHVC